ncbi:MAG: hypothetical protein ACKVZJ_05100 [Phycisphaerales bacterium]
MIKRACAVLAAALGLGFVAPAFGAFHLWRVSEIYSDSTGNVQFIEMFTTFSGQQFMSTHTIACTNLAGTQTNTYLFQANTCAPTNNKRIVLGTAGYGAAAGSVTADYVIPANFLFKEGGTINFGPNQQTFAYPALPNNGTDSLRDDTFTTSPPYVFTPGVNNPTNCAGQVGSLNITPPACKGDLNNDGERNTADLTGFLGAFGLTAPPAPANADFNDDGNINTADLTAFLGVFGIPCP